jgi:hypothetical protein
MLEAEWKEQNSKLIGIKTNKLLKPDLGAELQGHAWLIEVWLRSRGSLTGL